MLSESPSASAAARCRNAGRPSSPNRVLTTCASGHGSPDSRARTSASGSGADAASAEPRAQIRGELDSELRAQLVRAVGDVDEPPSNRFEARRRARAAMESAEALLRSEGYYQPTLVDQVEGEETPVAIIEVTPGPRFLLADYGLNWTLPPPDPATDLAVRGEVGLITGDPDFLTWAMDASRDGQVRTGIWQSTPGENHSIKGETFEFCHLLEGVIELTEDGQPPRIFRKGDSFLMKPGYRGVWKTLETVRKVYVIVG